MGQHLAKLLLVAAIASAPPVAGAAAGDPATAAEEPRNAGWTLHLDNDGLLATGRDQQYTGGLSLELAGARAAEYPWSLDPILGFADRLSGFGRLSDGVEHTRRHSFFVGLAVFTPEDIDDPEPIDDDHPYGNLLTLGNIRQTVDRENGVRYKSSFNIGLLGTNAGEAVQDFAHEVRGIDKAQGWDNQIADGGEPTALYRVSRQALLARGDTSAGRGYDWRYDTSAALGHTTEATIGSSVRWGRIRSDWWSFDPAFTDYLDTSGPLYDDTRLARREWFVWLGMKARLRLYNALLEGQFRDSAVTFSRSELRLVIGELGTGVQADLFDTGFQVGFEVRARTREIDGAEGEQPVFGRMTVSRRF